MFTLSAFEPTEEELNPKKWDDSDVEMLDVEEELVPKKKGKGKAKPKRKTRRAVDDEFIDVDAMETEDESSEESEDDNLSDFIVPDDADDDDEYTLRPKKMKKPMINNRKNVIIIDSDEKDEDPEEKELILGRKRKSLSAKEIKMLPRFFPSTKMKVRALFAICLMMLICVLSC
jgi:hypothetical protein